MRYLLAKPVALTVYFKNPFILCFSSQAKKKTVLLLFVDEIDSVIGFYSNP